METKDVSSDKKERRDFFGNVIKRKNKKKIIKIIMKKLQNGKII